MAYRNPDITALYEGLRPFDTLEPPDRYWIEDSLGQDATGGLDFCFECGSEYVDRLNLYTPGEITHDLTCCDPCGYSDVIPHCDHCGKTLDGWPTDYCASEELIFFEENEAEPTPENVRVVNMMLWNLQWSEDDDEVAAWRSVAQKMAAKLPEPAMAACAPMGAYFTAMILDIAHGWIGSSSESDRLVVMSEDQIVEWQGMEERHEMERQAFLRGAFHG